MWDQPKCITLVGLPGSGKTSWRRGFIAALTNPEDWVVVSSDDMIEKFAADTGRTYNSAFQLMKDRINSYCAGLVASAKQQKKNVIFDQTNLTRNKRKNIVRTLPGYKHYLVSFLDIPTNTIFTRNANREAYGRDIPTEILKQMSESTCHEFGDDFELLPSNLSEIAGQFHD